MAISTIPQNAGVPAPLEYKRTQVQQKVYDLLSKPESLARLAPLIGVGVDFEAVALEVYRAVTKNPAILQCTEDSVVMSVADCLRVGLVIGKTIHLVPVPPRRGEQPELQAWTDYKGDIELVVAAGGARHIEAHAVYEADVFEVHLGTDPSIVHRPELMRPRGKMIGAYAVAFITAYIKKVCVMRLDEIDAIRSKSRQWNPGKEKDCPEWYACKTTIHRICKDLPKNAKLMKVMALFDRQDEVEHGADDPDLAPEKRVEPMATARATVAQPSANAAPAERDFDVEDEQHPLDEQQAAPAAAATHQEAPTCPKCGGPMYDNRAMNATRQREGKKLLPEFKCKRRDECGGLYWAGEWPPQDELQF